MQTIEVTKVNVAALHDTQLDALLDRYVFHMDPWCEGSIWVGRCTLCGAVLTPTMAQHYFGNSGHHRQVPRYTENKDRARSIYDVIARLGKTTRSCFTLALCCYRPPLANMQDWLIFDPTPRQIAVAALQSVEIIDRQGFLVVEGI